MGFSDRRMIRMLPRSVLTGCSSKLLLMIRIEPKSGWTSDDADDLLRTLKDPKSGVLTERRIILIKLTHKISGRDLTGLIQRIGSYLETKAKSKTRI